MSYLILSAKHSPRDALAVWWVKGTNPVGDVVGEGYTTDLAKAGRYPYVKALDLCFPGHSKIPPASFAVDENSRVKPGEHGYRLKDLDSISWEEACERFIPDGQPVQQTAGRRPIVLNEAPLPLGWNEEEGDVKPC